jgi:DNA-binding IclR family transcriptional regulator
MTTGDGSPRTLKTLGVAADVIEVLVAEDEPTVTEVADRLDLSKSTAFRYLKTLAELEFVTETDDGYKLSYRFLLLGEYARNSSQLYQIGREEVDKLAEELGYYVHLVTETDGYGVSLYQARGGEVTDFDYQSTKLQQRDPLHVTASGKAILAHLPREQIDAIVEDRELERRTSETITDRDALLETLEAIRERGYAYNDEEEIEGFRAVGAPIVDQHDRVLGSVSVSAPTSFLTGSVFTDEIPTAVTKTANVIELNVNMSEKQETIAGI